MRLPKPFIHACWKPETAIRHLPQAYRDFYSEWQHAEPTPVHYEPRQGNWYKDEKTGEIKRTYNVPITLSRPRELDHGLWGGEAVIKGYTLVGWLKKPVARWWVPKLKRTTMYSEVLDQYMELLATERAIWLVHKHYGLDYYLLQTRACDIMSLLGLRIKRQIYLHLARQTLWPNDAEKRAEILDKYRQYIIPEDRAEWYGLTVDEALQLHREKEAAAHPASRLKEQYRREFIDNLLVVAEEQANAAESKDASQSRWWKNYNPFRQKSQ